MRVPEPPRPSSLPVLLPLAVALLWEIAADRGWIEARLLPPPSAVARTLRDLAATGDLQRHVLATLARVAWGFGLGVLVATVLGALTGYSTAARRLLDPTLQALRNIPSIAWVPLFILWFGIFEASKVALIAVGVFFPVYLGLMAGIREVDRKLVEVGRAYELSPVAMVWRILLPAALPAYLTGIRSGLGLGWMFVIAAELMGASEGLGYLLLDGQMTGNAAQIVASLVLFARPRQGHRRRRRGAPPPPARLARRLRGEVRGARARRHRQDLPERLRSAGPARPRGRRGRDRRRRRRLGLRQEHAAPPGRGPRAALARRRPPRRPAGDGPSREVGIVFQEPRLMPWLSVRENVAFGLGRLPRAERRRLAEAAVGRVRLADSATRCRSSSRAAWRSGRRSPAPW